MNSFIGLDIGTSAVKGVLLSEHGDILSVSCGEFEYYKDGSGVLMDPSLFVNTCFQVINNLCDTLPKDCVIKAICPCCASGSLLFLDQNCHPLTPIIGWQSSIPESYYHNLYSEQKSQEIYETIGWGTLNGFPVALLPWISRNRLDIIANAHMICMAAEYLNYVLTRKWGISHSMGTPFYLINQANGIYDTDILESLGILESQLPPIYNKGHILGDVVDNLEGLLLPSGTPVVLGSFDHPSCATGAGVYEPGEVLLSCGTSWVEFFPIKKRSDAIHTGLLVDRFMLDGSPYCVMSSITSFSMKINALRKHFFGNMSYEDFDKLACNGKMGCNGLRFCFDDSDFNKTIEECKENIARAIYESAGMELKKNLKKANAINLYSDKITMVGGVTNSPVCMQIIADTLGKEIRVVNGVSAGAVGAAMLAGIGTKIFKNEKGAFSKLNFKETIYKPKCRS